MSHTPSYRLSASFPVRRVLWRPGFECELAFMPHADFGTGSGSVQDVAAPVTPHIGSSSLDEDQPGERESADSMTSSGALKAGGNEFGDPVEIWDVRREWIAKWVVRDSGTEGGLTGMMLRFDDLLKGYSSSANRSSLRGLADTLGPAFFWNVLTTRSSTLHKTHR